MQGDHASKNNRLKESPKFYYVFLSIGATFLMLILTFIIITIGQKSVFLVSFFFLLLAYIGLRLPLKLTMLQAAIASVLTLIVLYSQSHQWISILWIVNTIIYLAMGMVINYEVSSILRFHRHEEEISALSHISGSLTKTLDLSDLTRQVVDQLQLVFEADGCAIFLIEEGNKYLRAISVRDSQNDPVTIAKMLNSHPRVGFGMVGWIAATGEPILSGNAEKDPRALHIPGTPFDDESVMGIPVKAEGKTFGVLWIYKMSLNVFDEEDFQLAQIFANQVSAALANARLYEHVRRLSETDGLTGLLNSRSLPELTQSALNHASSIKGHVSLLFLDCDNFKSINDLYGHPTGDQFLRFFASLLLDGIRDGDIVVRYAGDEFVILLPDTDLESATGVAIRLIDIVQKKSIKYNPNFKTTVSVGLATYPEHATKAEDLIKHADEALYTAKRNGKNQLSIYNPSVLINNNPIT